MRHSFLFSLVYLIGILITCPMYADDDCSQALQEGISVYNAGDYRKAKDLFDYVTAECGGSYGNASSWSRKCVSALTPTLSVSRSNISVPAKASAEYITVTSNTNWEIEPYSSAMFSAVRDGNKIKVTIYENTITDARSGFFNISTKDGRVVQKITLSQAGKVKESASASAEIDQISIEYDVMHDGQSCMKIHVKFAVNGALNHKVGACVHFKYQDSKKPLIDTNGKYADANGHVAHSKTDIAKSEHSRWNDFILYFPNSELHLSGENVSVDMEFGIYDWTTSKWLTYSNAKIVTIIYNYNKKY